MSSRALTSATLLLAASVGAQTPVPLTVAPTQVTVTARRGAADQVAETPQLSLTVDRARSLERPAATIGHALAQEPGILVQQTTAGQVSPFLRGLTGYHVLNLIDGVRFNNSTFRSGPNQYLVFVEPSQARRVEALLGPSGSQYGSDALGGVINVITPAAEFSSGPPLETRGEFSFFGASADASTTGSAQVALGGRSLSWLAGAGGRRMNDVRAGAGFDSRHVFRRLFGLSPQTIRELTGDLQQDTAFTQYGAHSRLNARLGGDQLLSVWYQRGELSGVRGYKDLWGGLGRMVSSFQPQSLDFFYGRYEKLGLGFLESLSGVFSVNSQSDGSLRQNLRDTDPITTDDVRVNAFGYTVQASARAGSRLAAVFGADVCDEHIHAARTVQRPSEGASRAARPLYPDRSAYRTFGAFVQANGEIVPSRLRLGLGSRFTVIRYSHPEAAAFGVAASMQRFRDLTFNTSLAWDFTRHAGLHLLIGRGFRAPNLNDLGAIGLNDLGYEIPAAEAIPAGALLADSAGENAVAQGKTLTALRPESLLSYEGGLRVHSGRFYGRVHVFDAELYDPIVRRTLVFPATAAPSRLAGIPVSVQPPTAAQSAQGVVTVATAFDPRAVKAFVNDGRACYAGVEAVFRYAITRHWQVHGAYTFLAGRELKPDRNVRRLPPQMGLLATRYSPASRRFWVEWAASASGAQRRLSGGDLDDERIGASRRRTDIGDFFGGTRVKPFLDSAGRFAPTGETLREIQDRVLPIGAIINGVAVLNDSTRVPLYSATAGWVALEIRGGIPLGEGLTLLFALSNLADKNYRVYCSGLDAPGRSAYAGFRYVF